MVKFISFLIQRIKALVIVLCVLGIGKYAWFDSYVLSAKSVIRNKAWHDLDRRRTYLLKRVARAEFGTHDIPEIIESPFREELAISTLSMTTAALTNIAFLKPETREESLLAVKQMILAMLKKDVRNFEVHWWGYDPLDHLEDGNGQIGYLGHLNFMLGAYRLLGGDSEYDALHKKISKALSQRLTAESGFHAPTMPGVTFTADNTFVYVSLAHYDKIYGDTYSPLIRKWVTYTKNNLLDPETGMVLYHVGTTGRPQGTPRGVLQAWNSVWLPHIDKAFARAQYTVMKKYLEDAVLFNTFAGIREYQTGKSGPTDGIAGPIIAGISGSATGFALGGARWHGEEEFLQKLLHTTELIGSTISWGNKRFYLTAPLVGEAIVLTSLTVTDWDNRYLLQGGNSPNRT